MKERTCSRTSSGKVLVNGAVFEVGFMWVFGGAGDSCSIVVVVVAVVEILDLGKRREKIPQKLDLRKKKKMKKMEMRRRG